MSINTVSLPPDDRDMNDVASRDESARHAASIIYSSRSYSNEPVSSTPSASQNGRVRPYRVNERELRFSSVRRMFCLLTVFDFGLLLLLWIIYINIIGLGIIKGMICQVEKYNFETSMFDVVALSFVRMGLLLIAYAAFKSRHWAMVAITTFITCVLLLSKVFLYDFAYSSHHDEQCLLKSSIAHPVDYFLLIASFTIAWIEVWVLDFKVIPREYKLRNSQRLAESGSSETEPLLHGHAGLAVPSSYLGTHQDFYSPIESPKGSDSESGGESGESSPFSGSYVSRSNFLSLPNSQRGSSVNLAASIEEQEYIQKAKESSIVMDKVLDAKEGWNVEKTRDGVTLESHMFEGIVGKVYRLKGIVPITAESLVHTLWDNFDSTSLWNTTVLDCKVLHQIDDHIDIIYSLAAPGPGGVVASRDFVCVRNYWERGDRRVCSSIGVKHPSKPEPGKYVRGFNAVGGWVTEPVEGDPTSCLFTWILHSDLKFKVWTPQAIIDTALGHVLLEMHSNLIKHIQSTFPNPTTSDVDEQGDAGNQETDQYS